MLTSEESTTEVPGLAAQQSKAPHKYKLLFISSDIFNFRLLPTFSAAAQLMRGWFLVISELTRVWLSQKQV